MARKKKEIPPMQEEDLRRLAEIALEKYKGKISTTIIQRGGQEGIVPKNFYASHCKGPEQMDALVKRIRELDPERYSHVKYERIHDGPASRSKLNPDEEELMVEMIIKSYEKGDWRSDNPPLELIRSIKAALEVEGHYRSVASITSHSRNMWSKQKISGLPAYIRSPRPKAKPEIDIGEELDAKLDAFGKRKKDKTIDALIDSGHNEQERKHYLSLANRSHQALVAFMMDPKNYKKLLGSDYELVAVDFTKANTPHGLYDKCKDKAELLEKICEQEGDIVSFVDNWLRCDMIFRDGEGSYHVAEIKQNAVNHNINGRKGYPNADKVVEQISAYTGGLRGRIAWMNRNRPEAKKIPEQLNGMVVAYAIDPELYEFLIEKDELRPIRVSRRAVGSYLKGLGAQENE